MKDAIFVVGMGRSGSSALTRVLSLCGAALPRRVLAANSANPTGYWEPERVVALNERFLHAHGSSWFDASLRLQHCAPGGEPRARFVREAAVLLEEAFEDGGPLVVKDPRISGLLPYWTAAAEQLGLRPAFVHVFRNPDDVVASLVERDALPEVQAYALWLKYNVIAERDTRAFARVFVSYEDLLDDWERVVRRSIGELRVPLAIDAAARGAVGRFLSPAMCHHASGRGPSRGGGAVVNRTYELLKAARRVRPDGAAFDAMLARYPRVPADALRAPAWSVPSGAIAESP